MSAQSAHSPKQAVSDDVKAALALITDLEGAPQALATFDYDRLQAMEDRLQHLTAAQLANARGLLPTLLQKHAHLGQMLDATAANLKVLVSVLNLEMRTETR